MLNFFPLNLYAAQCTTGSSTYTDERFDNDMDSMSGTHAYDFQLFGCKATFSFPKVKGKKWTEWNSDDYEYVIGIFKEAKVDRDVCFKELKSGNESDDIYLAKLSCLQATAAQNNNHASASKNSSNAIVSNSKGNNKNTNSAESPNSKAQKKIDSEKVYASKESNLATEEANKQNNSGSKNKLSLLTEAPCISVRNTKGGNVNNIFKWVIFHNSCAYDIRVRFCTELNCTQATQADVYHSGDSEKYPAPLHNKRWHIGVRSACKLTSGMSADGQGGQGEVYSDNNGSCFVYVKE